MKEGVERRAMPGGGEIPVVDWLRGVAAVGVVVFHARVDWWVGWRAIMDNPDAYGWFDRAAAWMALPAPFMGSLVMLFFVLSGFCVHQPLVRGDVEWRDFFRRRFVRLYPPYLTAAALSIGALWWMSPPDFPGWGRVVAVLTMTQNYQGNVAEGVAGMQVANNPSLWSLPVEMELYCMYPFFWLAARAWGWAAAMSGVALVSVGALAGYHGGGRFLEGNFAMYWIIWCSGAWLRERCARGTLGRPPRAIVGLGAVALAGGIVLTLEGVGGLANVGWGGAYFVLLWACVSRPRLAGTGMWRMIGVAAGKISYSLYLMHFPVLMGLAAWWAAHGGERPTNYLMCLLACAATLPVACLFYRWVERPSHGWARNGASRVEGAR